MPLSMKLLKSSINMIHVNMTVAERTDKLTWNHIHNTSYHMGKQGVRCDIDWNANAIIARPLAPHAAQCILRDIILFQFLIQRFPFSW